MAINIASPGVHESALRAAALLNLNSIDTLTFQADRTGATDVTADLKAALEAGYGRVEIPDGDYLIAPAGDNAGGVVATITKSLWVRCGPNTRFFTVAPGLDSDLISIIMPLLGAGLPSTKISIIWEGGLFDQREQKNSTVIPFANIYPAANLGTSGTCDGLQIRPSWLDADTVTYHGAADVVRVLGARFLAGDHWETAGGDTGLFLGAGADEAECDTWHQGNRDVGVYISGDGFYNLGRNAKAHGTYIACYNGQAFKRAYRSFTGSGYFRNCVNGQLTNRVVGAEITGGFLTGTYENCQCAVAADYNIGLVWSGGLVFDMGGTDAAGAVLSTSLRPDRPRGIYARGMTQSLVHHNVFSGFNSLYDKADCSAAELNLYDPGDITAVLTRDNQLNFNTLYNIRGMGSEHSAEADANSFFANRYISCDTAGPTLFGTNSSDLRYTETGGSLAFRKAATFSDGTAALPSVARAAQLNTGVFFGTNKVGLSGGGTDRLGVKSTNPYAVMPTYADNAAAVAGGLVATDLYKTATGEVRVVV